MRKTTAVSLTVIALALAAIGGGYLSGEAGARPPKIVTFHAGPSPKPSSHAVSAGYSDSATVDLFSDDDVVIDRTQIASGAWQMPSLSIVVGLSGESAALDGEFLRLGLPLAFDIDPHGAEADRVAEYVTSQGLVLLVHVNAVPSHATLDALRKRFGHIDGIASRDTRGMSEALRGTGLVFFDERGDSEGSQFSADGVAYVARDARVDDHSSPSYISFMLEQTALRSEREGRKVILMRPLPNSLAALSKFLGTRSAQIVALTPSR